MTRWIAILSLLTLTMFSNFSLANTTTLKCSAYASTFGNFAVSQLATFDHFLKYEVGAVGGNILSIRRDGKWVDLCPSGALGKCDQEGTLYRIQTENGSNYWLAFDAFSLRSTRWILKSQHERTGDPISDIDEIIKFNCERFEPIGGITSDILVDRGSKIWKEGTCTACHGLSGEGGIGPKLRGQTKTQIIDKLKQYKSRKTLGDRSSVMWAMAASLSEDDIVALGNHISGM